MQQPRTGSHSVHKLQVHLVWSTKYRYQVLTGDVQLRCRDLLRQTCNVLDVQILTGVVSKKPYSSARFVSALVEFE